MSKRKTIIMVPVTEYPASFYQTPDEVKDLLEELQYQLLRKEEPFKWRSIKGSETFIDEPWDEESLRSLARGLTEAKMGWARTHADIKVTRKEAKRFRKQRRQAREAKPMHPPTDEERAQDQVDAASGEMPTKHIDLSAPHPADPMPPDGIGMPVSMFAPPTLTVKVKPYGVYESNTVVAEPYIYNGYCVTCREKHDYQGTVVPQSPA